MEEEAAVTALASGAPCLDTRPLADFVNSRVRGSAHMSLADLQRGHQCWLPDRHVKLCVVLPGGAGSDAEQAEAVRVCLSHYAHARFLGDSAQLWQAVRAAGLLEQDGPPPHVLRRRLLFPPCPLLSAEIERIERLLLDDGPSPGEGQRVLRALEPGCGSARNLVHLAVSHSSTSSHCSDGGDGGGAPSSAAPAPRRHRWDVLGFDCCFQGLDRAQELLQTCGVPPSQAQLWLSSVCSRTGALQPAPLRTQATVPAGLTHIRVPQSDELENGSFDLIACVRFLERSFLPRIPQLLAPGGFLLFMHFVDGPGTRSFGRPKGDKHLLQADELRSLFGASQGFEILRDEVAAGADGRELSMFLARRQPLRASAAAVWAASS